MSEIIQKKVRQYLIHSFLYYQLDESIISDRFYDQICNDVLNFMKSNSESNIIPYGLYLGIRDNLRGLNLIGLKRKKIDSKAINNIHQIFKKIFDHSNSIEKNINNLNEEQKSITEIKEIIDFILLNLKRGICRYNNE